MRVDRSVYMLKLYENETKVVFTIKLHCYILTVIYFNESINEEGKMKCMITIKKQYQF